ncbi:adenylyl-sulfate kinase [Syntrophomonas wolfei]|uniref:adenylyl-sulfate kinase n=1 Tax=Syntrophomonas wolfei TaxID=863 RepID=UPI0023F30095|nr:adenylyl-sulfate kinase [Syntrophomonas wolfei]
MTSLDAANNREDMNIVVVGHVDHGKSTIIGRLLADTDSLPQGKLDSVRESCRRNSRPFEYAFLLDALKDEQHQGITIDAARCFFKTDKRNYMILDTPGHIEFLKNMVTGVSRAEAALLVIDAWEGIMDNSRRHGFLLSMLGIKQIVVLINKMDLIAYDEGHFEEIKQEYHKFLGKIGINAPVFIPVSGMKGDNIVSISGYMPWYQGDTVLNVLDHFIKEKPPEDKPFRMPVQDVYKFTAFGDQRRIVAGTIETGKLLVGDEVVFYPSQKRSTVKSIESFNTAGKMQTVAGEAAAFTLQKQIYVKRGELAFKAEENPPQTASRLLVNMFWLGKKPMEKNKEYFLKLGTAKVKAGLHRVVRILDAVSLESSIKEQIEPLDVAECVLWLNKEIAFDLAADNLSTGRFVIVDDYEISGGGIIKQALFDSSEWIREKALERKFSISAADNNLVWQDGKVSYTNRCQLMDQRGLVVWFTGLSGAGKSTIAIEVEEELIKRNKLVYRLDGDNVRHGLNNDLGFTRADRNENIRRIAEVANLFKDAAVITLVAAISPYVAMRSFARERIGSENFIEVFVKADIEECIKRDPKGFYARAQQGQISGYTGIDDPYEEPENPEIIIDTMRLSASEAADMVLDYLFNQGLIKD